MTTFALLWSRRTGDFHIEPLAKTLEINRLCYEDNEEAGYAVLHCGTEAECEAEATRLRSQRVASHIRSAVMGDA